jgi:phage virion morphogenesis protein
MSEITLDIDAGPLNARLASLMTPEAKRDLMNRLGRVMRTQVQRSFDTGKDPDGNAWKPTIRGGQILRDTGRLRNSIDYQVHGDDEVHIGTNVIYAPVHQFGATIRAKNARYLKFMVGGKFVQKRSVTIPARPFMGFGQQREERINKAVNRWVTELLGAS